MGCDIHGYIETVKYPNTSPDLWDSVVDISNIVGRNYSMFGFLFGQRNNDNFNPVIKSPRGLPTYKYPEESQTMKESNQWSSDGHSHTWITWKEIKNAKWDQKVTSSYITQYKELENGTLQEVSSFMGSSGITDEDIEQMAKGLSVRKKYFDDTEYIFKHAETTPKEHISGDWQTIFDIMERLAKQVGEDNVRLVVWFDN